MNKIYEALLEVDITPLLKHYTYDEIAKIFDISRSAVNRLMNIHTDSNRLNNYKYSTGEKKGYAGAWMDSEERRVILSYQNESSDTIIPNNIESLLESIKI